jgi:hypothetical protein
MVPSSLPLISPEMASWEREKKRMPRRDAKVYCNLILKVMSHQFSCILFVRHINKPSPHSRKRSHEDMNIKKRQGSLQGTMFEAVQHS